MALSLRFALCFLSFVILLLIMNGHGSSGRDMKEPQEEAEEKQVNQANIASYGTKPVSKDPYSVYEAAYTSKKHIHPSHQEDEPESNQPYLTGYRTTQKDDQKEMGRSYITAYRTSSAQHSNQPYITAYRTSSDGSNQPYTTSYGAKPVSKDPYSVYIAAYTSKKPISKDPYSGYKAAYTSNKHIHPFHQPYLTGYITTQKDQKEMNGPYITQYGNSKVKKDSKDSYAATYRKTEYTSKKHTHPFHQPYLTGYITTQKDRKEMNGPYITQYGNSKVKKDSKDSYAATYRKTGQDLEGSSSKVDHTEAFKTGFFSLDDVYAGNIMTLQFPVQDFAHFLPRKEADTIPFSMSQLPSVLQLFSINEDSDEGQAMKDIHEQCEVETLTGETKVCATSLESMLEFVRTILGTESGYDILTTSYPTASSVPLQNYTVLEVSEDIYAPKWVSCHPLPYPYAVFFCHYIGTGSKIFKVLLGGENGNKMEALGICHLDTSEWSPDHVIFRQLGTKPGEAPICHFFPVKHLMWVPLPSKATM